MSWDVAIYGDLLFPDAASVARWRGAAVDPAPEIRTDEDVSGTVDDVLKPLAGEQLDWVDVSVSENAVSIRGQLAKDAYNQDHPAIVAAVRAAAEVGGRGELWLVGLGIDLGYVLRLEDRSFTKVRGVPKDPRIDAIIAEAARRARLPPVEPPKLARELLQLAQAKDPARAVAILETTPKGDYWKEYSAIEGQLAELHARFGREVFPVLVAMIARFDGLVGTKCLQILFALETPEATDIIVERMSAPLYAAELATWLLAHPALALPALRRVAEWPDDAQGRFPVTYPLAPMNELARRVLAELTNEPAAPDPPMLAKGTKKPPPWFHPAVFARPRLVDGSRLSSAATKRLVALLKTLSDGDRSAFDALLPLLDRRSLDTLLVELFRIWCDTGAKKPDRYLGEAIRLLGDTFARERLTALSQTSTVAGRQARSLLS